MGLDYANVPSMLSISSSACADGIAKLPPAVTSDSVMFKKLRPAVARSAAEPESDMRSGVP